MSLLSGLKTLSGSTHYKKRLGRGNGSGKGGTSGKGHKGQRARTGGKVRRGFEGGQTPLHRRLPKFGFNPISKVEFDVVNLAQLNKFDGEVKFQTLIDAGLARKGVAVKILAKGALSKKLIVQANAFSEKAKAAIEAAGGKAEVVAL